jgi:hypothetical protein
VLLCMIILCLYCLVLGGRLAAYRRYVYVALGGVFHSSLCIPFFFFGFSTKSLHFPKIRPYLRASLTDTNMNCLCISSVYQDTSFIPLSLFFLPKGEFLRESLAEVALVCWMYRFLSTSVLFTTYTLVILVEIVLYSFGHSCKYNCPSFTKCMYMYIYLT